MGWLSTKGYRVKTWIIGSQIKVGTMATLADRFTECKSYRSKPHQINGVTEHNGYYGNQRWGHWYKWVPWHYTWQGPRVQYLPWLPRHNWTLSAIATMTTQAIGSLITIATMATQSTWMGSVYQGHRVQCIPCKPRQIGVTECNEYTF